MESELSRRLDRIAERLSAFSDEQWGKVPWWLGDKNRPFGADKHRFDMYDPLLESELVDFEQQCGVGLPSDYRAFLRHVGDGGAGPYYGLAPLGVYSATIHVLDTEVDPHWIGRTCPLRYDLPATHPNWLVAMGGDEWKSRIDRGEWHPYQGSITLSNVGCGYYFVLVLTGQCKGRVCGVHDGFDDTPLFPRYDSFVSWYEAWLDSVDGTGPSFEA